MKRSEDNKHGNVIANQSETVMTGLHKETTESEVAGILKEMMKEIGMDFDVLPSQSLMPLFTSRTTTKETSSSDRQTCYKKN